LHQDVPRQSHCPCCHSTYLVQLDLRRESYWSQFTIMWIEVEFEAVVQIADAIAAGEVAEEPVCFVKGEGPGTWA